MFGRIVLEPHQTGFVHCLDSTDCKARNQFCFVGYSSFDRLNGICVKVPREKICQITKDCEKGYFCSPVYGKANLFGDPGLVVKICYSEPLTYIQKQRNPRTNDIFFCNSTCNAPDVYCETMKEEMLGFKGFCAHVKEVNNRYPLYTLVNGADCQNHEQCAWTDFYENLPQEDKFRYTRSCEAYESHWFCMHGELQQRHCADYEHPSLTSDGTTYYCVDRKQPTSTLPPPPPRPLPTPSPPTTEPPLSTGSSTSAPRTSTIEPDDDDDDDDFEASTSEEQGVTQVITTEDSAAKREEGLETTTVIVIAAVVAVGILIALAAVALFVIARNKKDKKAKKSKAHKKTKKMRGNSSSGKNSGNSGGSQSSSIAN
ncbi:unnamed protein product [Caenorhabditis auriculariae]|uniref:Uncharacterized protein n=1 Tax=Caenorhabditis auriculariae TaxID=2777116 RepID=A0A8S1HNK3_9PELO|nr:unnamed protein product [Caenorhabditis auriculariae]